jgi:serine/threonine-protein kinase
MRIAAGTHLGDYEILSLLGQGGMGEVYRARDLKLRRDVAIKVISSPKAQDPAALARFRREAEAASALNHPNIVTVHGFGETTMADGSHCSYIVVELIEGHTLRALIRDRETTHQQMLRYCAQVAEGLAKAHAAGIVHRDLKPDNVMVSNDGYAKILDFGLAKLQKSESELPEDATQPLESKSGAVIGTAGYMAPEQVRGQHADPRSDIFAFGCILYEALTGKRAFEGDTQFDVLSNIVHEEPVPLHELWHDATEDVDRIVRRCLAKTANDRYQSARDLAIDLREIVGQSGVSERRPGFRPARRPEGRPTSWITVISLLVALIAIVIAAERRRSSAGKLSSLVILPFTNPGRDPQLDYLSDGVTDALLSDVSRMPDVRLIARTTSFRYKNTTKELPAIGRELGVDGIVTGQVRRGGERLIVDAELVDAKDGTRIWGDHYERSQDDMLAVERDIVARLAHALTGGGKATSATPPKPATENRAAYDDYLKGRYFWNKRTSESVTKALGLFQSAIDADPTYARAYSGIADCYIAFNQLGTTPRQQACGRGIAAAQRALELDESIPEAHTSMGYLHWSCELDLQATAKELRRALALSPNHAQAHHWYGLFLVNLGRWQEGLPHLREAARLDPFSTQIQANVAYGVYYSGHTDEAIKLANDAIELDRNAPYPYHIRGYIALSAGDYATAIQYLRTAVAKHLVVSMPFLAYTYARAGDRQSAMRTLDEIDKQSTDAARPPALIAGVWSALGNRDRAFELLERAYVDRDFWLSELRVSPVFDPLRDDPRFGKLLKRVDAR